MNTALAVETPWYASWFDTEYYHQLYATRDESEAQRFVDALLGHLQPVPRARMLDVGCGAGRHSRALAAHGHPVVGFDLHARTDSSRPRKALTASVRAPPASSS